MQNSTRWIRLLAGIVLALGFILLQGTVFRHNQLPLYILLPIALVIIVPFAWGLFTWLSSLHTFDELQRRVQCEAGLFSLAMVTLSTFGYGFLELSAGFPKLSMFWLLPLVMITYFLGVARAQWRYR